MKVLSCPRLRFPNVTALIRCFKFRQFVLEPLAHGIDVVAEALIFRGLDLIADALSLPLPRCHPGFAGVAPLCTQPHTEALAVELARTEGALLHGVPGAIACHAAAMIAERLNGGMASAFAGTVGFGMVLLRGLTL